MINQIISNPIFSGGLLLMASGTLMAALRHAPKKAMLWLRNRLLFTVELNNEDPAFEWLKTWVSDKGRSRYLSAGVTRPMGDDRNFRSERPRFFWCPEGASLLRFRGRRILFWFDKTPLQQDRGYRETITLQCFRASKAFFEDLLNDAYNCAAKINADSVEIWIPRGELWELVSRKAKRPLASICLADGIKERLIEDARRFLGRGEWYINAGIPFRRGYLFSGPPGNGKSSLAHVLASELGFNVHIANLTTFYDDGHLLTSLSRVPRGSILLLEDIDAVFNLRSPVANTKITFSGLLNAIDGVCAQEGRILIMTTNHISSLDPALIRPGRADVRVYIGNATPEQAMELFARFFPDSRHRAKEFANRLPEGEISMSAIQGYLLGHPDGHSAIAGVPELRISPKKCEADRTPAEFS